MKKDLEARARFASHFVRTYPDKKTAAERAEVPLRTVYQWFEQQDRELMEAIEAAARSQTSEMVAAYAKRALDGSDRAMEFLLSAWNDTYDPRARAAKIDAQGRIDAILAASGGLTVDQCREILLTDPMLLGVSDSEELETTDKKAYRSIEGPEGLPASDSGDLENPNDSADLEGGATPDGDPSEP